MSHTNVQRRNSEQEVDGFYEEKGARCLSPDPSARSLRHTAFHLQHVGPAIKLVCVGAVLYVLWGVWGEGRGGTSGGKGGSGQRNILFKTSRPALPVCTELLQELSQDRS